MKTKDKIIEEFHIAFKDSSLFECWDGCEKDITDWWIKNFSQQKQEMFEKGISEGMRRAREVSKLVFNKQK